MQTGLQKSNYPPNVSTLATVHEQSKEAKHFKVFSNLQQYLYAIEQIRIIDQLLKPSQKGQKQQTLKRTNAVLLQIKQQLDEIQILCKHFIGKEELFIQAQLITISEWKSQIRKIDRLMNTLLDYIYQNYSVIASVYRLETKIFNVGAKQWKRKCESVLKDPTCLCIKV